jgi:hypothetical protein
MFLTALSKSDYYAVHRILQADFQEVPRVIPFSSMTLYNDASCNASTDTSD